MSAGIEGVGEEKLLTPQELIHALIAKGWRQVDIANRARIPKADVSRMKAGQLRNIRHLRYFSMFNIMNEPPPVRVSKALVKKKSVQYMKGFADGVASVKEGRHE